MLEDDDATIFQTDEDREKIVKNIQEGRYELDSDDDTTTQVDS